MGGLEVGRFFVCVRTWASASQAPRGGRCALVPQAHHHLLSHVLIMGGYRYGMDAMIASADPIRNPTGLVTGILVRRWEPIGVRSVMPPCAFAVQPSVTLGLPKSSPLTICLPLGF